MPHESAGFKSGFGVSERTATLIQLALMFGLVAIGYALGRLHGRS